jgi:hypothetical protein
MLSDDMRLWKLVLGNFGKMPGTDCKLLGKHASLSKCHEQVTHDYTVVHECRVPFHSQCGSAPASKQAVSSGPHQIVLWLPWSYALSHVPK